MAGAWAGCSVEVLDGRAAAREPRAHGGVGVVGDRAGDREEDGDGDSFGDTLEEGAEAGGASQMPWTRRAGSSRRSRSAAERGVGRVVEGGAGVEVVARRGWRARRASSSLSRGDLGGGEPAGAMRPARSSPNRRCSDVRRSPGCRGLGRSRRWRRCAISCAIARSASGAIGERPAAIREGSPRRRASSAGVRTLTLMRPLRSVGEAGPEVGAEEGASHQDGYWG